VTPVLSVAAFHDKVTLPSPTVADKPVGVVGGVESCGVAEATLDRFETFPAASYAVT
jgi:hypothetical protein